MITCYTQSKQNNKSKNKRTVKLLMDLEIQKRINLYVYQHNHKRHCYSFKVKWGKT